MNLNQLYYFSVLSKTLNFHKASEQLNLTQPALSISISRLEDELGTFLFEREGRKVELTKAGMIYCSLVDEVLTSLEAANQKIKNYASRSSGHVDIGHIAPLSHHFIPTNIKGFLEETPSRTTTFSLRETSTLPLIHGLKSRQHDIVFCPYVPNQPTIRFVPILEQEIVAIVPEHHPLASRDQILLSELAPYPYVHYMPQSGSRKEIDKLIENSGWTPNIICDASDETGIATMVALGYGVSCVAHVETLDQCSGIRQLHIKMPGCKRTLYLAFLKDAYMAPAVQEFIRFITSKCIPVPGIQPIHSKITL